MVGLQGTGCSEEGLINFAARRIDKMAETGLPLLPITVRGATFSLEPEFQLMLDQAAIRFHAEESSD